MVGIATFVVQHPSVAFLPRGIEAFVAGSPGALAPCDAGSTARGKHGGAAIAEVLNGYQTCRNVEGITPNIVKISCELECARVVFWICAC